MPAGLFEGLVVSRPRGERLRGLGVSVAVHVALAATAVLVPLMVADPWPELLPTQRTVFLYDPPPPPPPPPLRGRALEVAPATAPPETMRPPLVAPLEVPLPPLPQEETAGEAEGSPFGSPEGIEGGVEGGEVGGVPGGVVGGVLGGTGTGPVPSPVKDYDLPPRPLSLPKPEYPQEAFAKKVEGTVTLEILIDETGRVARARVVKSVPLLDAAALRTVMTWRFLPALRKGRPVATVAMAPVSFRII